MIPLIKDAGMNSSGVEMLDDQKLGTRMPHLPMVSSRSRSEPGRRCVKTHGKIIERTHGNGDKNSIHRSTFTQDKG